MIDIHDTSANVQMEIDTGDTQPVNTPPYKTGPAQRAVVEEHINAMLKDNICQPSNSPWASPIVIVPKPGGKTRFCIDFRKLNKITKKDVYPLPRIDTLLDCFVGKCFFTIMDMLCGYWNVRMHDNSRQKTAFASHMGLFEFIVMPFGLTNAPAKFNSNNRRSYNNFNSRAHFHTQQNKSPRYCQRCKSYGHTQNLCPVSLQLNSRTYNSYNKQQTQYKPNNNFSNNQPNHNNNYKNNLNTNNYNNRSRGSRGFQSFNNRSSFRSRFRRPFRHNNQRFVRFSNTVDTLKEEYQDTSTFNNPNNNSDDCDNYNYDESDFHNVNPNLIPIDESNNISE